MKLNDREVHLGYGLVSNEMVMLEVLVFQIVFVQVKHPLKKLCEPVSNGTVKLKAQKAPSKEH